MFDKAKLLWNRTQSMSRSRLRELPLSSSLCLGLQAAPLISTVAKQMQGGTPGSVLQADKIRLFAKARCGFMLAS